MESDQNFATAPKARLPLGKQLFLWAVLLLFLFVVAESLSWVTLFLLRGGMPTYGKLRGDRAVLLDVELQPSADGEENMASDDISYRILHPYLGYVQSDKIPEYAVPQPTEDVFTAVLVGGSVARRMGLVHQDGPDALIAELEQLPQVVGKKIRFINLAADGYRQPQQLLLLNYLLALGADIDLFINLDGFNELYVPVNNRTLGSYAHYPEYWTSRMSWMVRKSQTKSERLFDVLMEKRIHAANGMQASPLAYSMTANVLWYVYDQFLRNKLISGAWRPDDSLHRFRETYGPLTASGSDITADSLGGAADMWEHSSLILHHLAASQGIAYVHFLQPNQYVPESKPMEDEERARAIGDFFWKGIIERGYPFLQEAGQRLQQEGVAFFDMTGVFASVTDPLYVDLVGHFNAQGDTILGKAMGEAIVSVLSGL
ncbi:hypothetical protein COU80_05800 [Candidatus Peregrinibacteria bacterium CG10_big_fil_rev_8_21_14_0_10_55_24]|nr:MAG: hypothetical protein COU80_05800 [Candidatus Peregrinibacteria bacterium CG10_big_fil_rev_8_21_14_0_10_55_24]